MIDTFYNQFIPLMNRSFNGVFEDSNGIRKNGWYLNGSTLSYFMRNYTLAGCSVINVVAAGDINMFMQGSMRLQWIPISDHEIRVNHGTIIVVQKIKSIGDIIEEYPVDYDRMKLHFPLNIGKICDQYDQNWTENIEIPKKPYPKNCFFDEERRKNGHEFISQMLKCGEIAGIKERMFLGFGAVLGYALRGDFLPNDDDIDMCIMADGVTKEQRHEYLVQCKKAGLLENRMRGPAEIDGKYVWFSIGPKSPYTEHGVKSCNWFWFEYGGYYWHSKGSKWIGRASLSDKYPTAKGIPVSLFKGQLKTIRFGSVDVQIPTNVGACLDWWYPGWVTRKKGSSKIESVLVMPSTDRKTWYIENR